MPLALPVLITFFGARFAPRSLLIGYQQAFESMARENQEATVCGGSFHWRSAKPVPPTPLLFPDRFRLEANGRIEFSLDVLYVHHLDGQSALTGS